MSRKPVLLRAVHLDAARFASKDAGRYQTTGALVKADGTVQATNGHYLVSVGPCALPADDFPERPERATEGLPEAGAIVPRETMAAVLKGMPKKRSIPVLATAHVGAMATGDVRLMTTDLETVGGATVKPLTGTFPDTERVTPDPEGMTAVGVNAAYLAEIMAFVARHNKSKHSPVVKILFDPKEPESKPMRIDFKATDGEQVTFVLMPMRLK